MKFPRVCPRLQSRLLPRLPSLLSIVLTVVLLLATLPLSWPPAQAASPNVVISQVYGGGGNSGAPYTNDYVELFNRGTAPVSLAGWSIQYTSATGTGNLGANTGQLTPLPSVTLAPGQYFLVQEASQAAVGSPLPSPDVTDDTPINMSGTAGKVAVVNTTASLGCNGGSVPCSATQLAQIVDLVGFGNANFFEGTGAAPTLSNTTAAFRAGAGCADTDDNTADFSAAAPTPRNLASPLNPCAGGTPTNTPTPTETPNGTATPTNTPTATLTPTATATPGATTRIHDIQGARHTSAFNGQTVTSVSGIVTAKRTDGTGNNANTGFYLQDPAPDADDATSEAIFVRTQAGAAPVNVGDAVTVLTGTVREWRPGCTSQSTWADTCSPSDSGFNNLTLTWLVAANGDIIVTSTGNALPTAIVIGTGGRVPPTTNVSSDVSNIDTAAGPTFNPASDGADFFESLEFMRVQVNDAVVVGPKTSNGEVGVLGDNGDNASGIRTPHGGILYSGYADDQPERIILDDQIIGFANMPAAHVGATMPLVVGVMDYSFTNFKLQVTAAPVMATNPLQRETTTAPGAGELTVATFNVENLTDGDAQSKFNTLATLIVTNMKAPDLIVIEEIQDNNGTSGGTVASNEVWDKLIQTIQTVGGVTYQYRQIDPQDGSDGGAPGGNIRQGFLFRTDRGLAFVPRGSGGLDCSTASPTPAGCATTAVAVQNVGGAPQLSLSPGRIAPADGAWSASRKPLAAEFTFNGRTLFVVGNHFNSKGGDQPLYGRFDPPTRTSETQRHQQAALLNQFVDQILTIDPNALVVTAGDFNDFDFSQTLAILRTGDANGSGDVELHNLYETLPANERYSYVFDANSQILDSILVSPALLSGAQYDVVHVNAEFADQASDHDPSVARLSLSPAATMTPTATATATATPTGTATETPTPTSTATSTSVATDTPVPTSTATATATSTNTPVATSTSTRTPTSTATATATATPATAGSIELRLDYGQQTNRSLRYDPPGPAGVLIQTFDGEPGCGRFASQPSLMQATGTRANGQSAPICMLNIRLGVEKGPWPGPFDNFRVNQGEKLSFSLGTHQSVSGKMLRSAGLKVEGERQTTVRVTAYNGTTVVGTQTVPLSSLQPQGPFFQSNNYTIAVDFGQAFTRLELTATAGSFSIVGGANNSGPTTFALTN